MLKPIRPAAACLILASALLAAAPGAALATGNNINPVATGPVCAPENIDRVADHINYMGDSEAKQVATEEVTMATAALQAGQIEVCNYHMNNAERTLGL